MPPPSVEMKEACSHRHTQSLMDLMWRGGSAAGSPRLALPPNYPYLKLTLHALLPIYPPAGRRSRQQQAKKGNSTFFLKTILDTRTIRTAEAAASVVSTGDTKGDTASLQQAEAMRVQMRLEHEIRNILGTTGRAAASQAAFTRGAREHCISHLFAFYRIPAVSFVLRALAHLLCLVASGLQLQYALGPEALDELAPDLPPFSAFEAFQLVNTLAQSLDRVLQIVDRDELYSPHQSRSLLQRSLLQIDWLFFAAVILRIAAPLVAEYSTGRLLYSYYLSLLSIHGVTICLGLLPLLGRSLSLTLGTRSPSCVSSAECTD